MMLEETARLYVRAMHVIDYVRMQVWERMGITFPQLRILFRVRRDPGIDLRSLARELSITASAAGQQVDKLVVNDLVRRSEDPEDRRRVQLELTDLGEQAVGEISRTTRGHIESVLSALSDQDLADLRRLLKQIVAIAAEAPIPNVS
ncbi:MAG: MarR family transcriptional regulator [Chloroflexi bacterium]|nr:MarR family transcriptional regulator [Chloroflexota bacterium]